MGAIVAAAAAAAHQRRIAEVLDAYRVAGATSPSTARDPLSLGVGAHAHELRELEMAGVLVPGPMAGTFYLGEKDYIAWRDSKRGVRKRLVLVALFLVFMAALVTALTIGNSIIR